MGSYEANLSVHESLAATVVDTVLFEGSVPVRAIMVQNRDAAATIYFRVDGVAPVVAAPDTHVLVPGQIRNVQPNMTGPAQVQLISSATAAYSVIALPTITEAN
jgi:hypothetical protein